MDIVVRTHSQQAIDDLDKSFGIPGAASVVLGNGRLPKVVVSTPSARGEMYLNGGHVTSWKLSGTDEVLYLSPSSIWAEGHAIRGGVPISFPWFAGKADDHNAPAHGFVRTKAWQPSSIEIAGPNIAVCMSTESDAETRKWWPFDFRLISRATFGVQLKIELSVTNTGASSFSFEEALHAYFRVGNAETAFVEGLDATDYIDKTDRNTEKKQSGSVRFLSETDRVYLDSRQELELLDPAWKRRVSIQKENSLTTVVWNPWAEKSRSMTDLGGDSWKDFVCVETSNVARYAVNLGPGQEHSLATIIRVASWQQR